MTMNITGELFTNEQNIHGKPLDYQKVTNENAGFIYIYISKQTWINWENKETH